MRHAQLHTPRMPGSRESACRTGLPDRECAAAKRSPACGRAEKTVNYCNCQANYTVSSASGQQLSSAGGCIQDPPNTPPWCPVVEATCSFRPPRRNGIAWDVCRGAQGSSKPLNPSQAS